MAKVVDQSIPSEDRIKYKRQCQISTKVYDTHYVRSRYPWRIPISQAGGRAVSPSQKVQRDRFIYVFGKYALLSASDKERWKDANPEWRSYLFGYNFFMLEGLIGGGPIQYPQMIKSIQVLKASAPTIGGHTFNLDPTIDGSKAVVLIQGSARKVPIIVRGSASIATGGSDQAHGGTVDPDKCTVELFGSAEKHFETENYAFAYNVWPYVYALTSSNIHIKFSLPAAAAADIAWEITEHVEGVVHPVLVSISNTQVAVDWAEEPDAAAEVSITVVEYL